MAEPVKNYDEDDAVCIGCIEDEALHELVEAEGHDQICVECGEMNTAVSIKDLAGLIDPYIPNTMSLVLMSVGMDRVTMILIGKSNKGKTCLPSYRTWLGSTSNSLMR